MSNGEDTDAYRGLQYIASHRLEINTKGKRRETFCLNIRERGENQQAGVYDSPEEISRRLARNLLEQRGGRFAYDGVSLTLYDANPHTTPREIYELMLNVSPSLSVNRGAATIRALGGERELLEKIADDTLETLRRTLGPEVFDGIAADQTSIVHHNIVPDRPIAVSARR